VDAAFVLAVVAILAFAFTNAIILAAVCNMLGPRLLGAAVADTIAGIVQVTAARRWSWSALL